MILKDIIDFIDKKIPPELALDFDNIGFTGEYDLNKDISKIKIYMDLLPEYDDNDDNTLIITHHPPIFKPKTPTYVIHSNWDIIDGGANDVLALVLGLEVSDYFDNKTHIGRICKCNLTFKDFKNTVMLNFKDSRIVNPPSHNQIIRKIGIISGFGLKNPDYIKLACEKNLDILVSGDLCQETAILSKYYNICSIDLKHHESEVPGLYKLGEQFSELNVDVEVINIKLIEKFCD